ncbi:MAG: glutamine--fructose-6-phosphate transaminase (isomerizing) [Candidatus Rokubacteria bacterium]|nr:glutamine--fructose-6-phosphate transaminase (isomerizing) [Candidatus Rokubacteria bacterium]
MCGIVGYIGPQGATGIILDGLKRLEYRGYDSAGVAVIADGVLQVRRSAGKIRNLERILRDRPVDGPVGIGHTRWATHGRPSEENAHPHTDCTGSIVVVHNGILENYLPIKRRLIAEGHTFKSETDTEVVAHLVEAHFPAAGSLAEAVRRALGELRGAYAIGVVSDREPDVLVAAKTGAGGVVIGLGEGEYFVASDIPAILSHTRDVIVLEDDEMAVVGRSGVQLSTLGGRPVERPVTRIVWDPIMAEKGGYRHFMLKEIYEQPRAITDTFRGRVSPETGDCFLPDLNLTDEELAAFSRIVLVACGTSYHAGLVGRQLIERFAGVPAETDIGSEFRYRDPLVGPDTLVVAISQSGETADTLGAVRTARQKGAPVVAICNVVGSALSREAHGVVYTHAGPEIGVASTKTFTATITALYLLALHLARVRGRVGADEGRQRLQELAEVPRLVEAVLAQEEAIAELARHLFQRRDFLYLGRGLHYPIALEGALKLKELSYIHAEGYPGGEMKHGPIALIDESMPVVALMPRDATYDRMLANIEEVRARDGMVIAVATEGDGAIREKAAHVLTVPAAAELVTPLLLTIPLQLFAYHVAVRRGCDVDQPRNLAKSVTVE